MLFGNIIQSYKVPCIKEFSDLFVIDSVFVVAIAAAASAGRNIGNNDNGEGRSNVGKTHEKYRRLRTVACAWVHFICIHIEILDTYET